MESTPTRPLAVVTGASAGIGRELAARFAEGGFDLIVAAEDARISAVARSFAESGVEAVPVQADLALFDGVEELHRAIQATGRTPRHSRSTRASASPATSPGTTNWPPSCGCSA